MECWSWWACAALCLLFVWAKALQRYILSQKVLPKLVKRKTDWFITGTILAQIRWPPIFRCCFLGKNTISYLGQYGRYLHKSAIWWKKSSSPSCTSLKLLLCMSLICDEICNCVLISMLLLRKMGQFKGNPHGNALLCPENRLLPTEKRLKCSLKLHSCISRGQL